MSAADIQRLAAGEHPNLVRTLFVATEPPAPRREGLPPVVERFLGAALDELEAIGQRVDELEARSDARESPELVQGHTVFLCRPGGYAVRELDGPAPPVGTRVEVDGSAYVVSRHGPSPFPQDARRCAVLESG